MPSTLNKKRKTKAGITTKAQSRSGGGKQSKPAKKLKLTLEEKRKKERRTAAARKRNATSSPLEQELKKMARNSRRSRG